MPANITESDNYPVTLQTPLSGELASAPGLLNQALQGLANRTNWMRRRLLGTGTTPDTVIPANNVFTPIQLPSAIDFPGPNAFTRIGQAAADQIYWLRRRVLGAADFAHFVPAIWTPLPGAQWTVQTDGTPALAQGRVSFVQGVGMGYIYFPLLLPPVGTISSIWMSSSGFGHSAVPTSPARLELVTMGDGNASPSILAVATDSATYPAYDTQHLTFAAVNVPIPLNSTFGSPNPATPFLRIIGESSAGAGGYQVFSLGVGVTQ